ncbi:MAG: heparinase II/III family protein [Chitinophagaceae bacterium]|nr:heparinase II/III family protein [Chitinophagaceae bacterium]MCW5928114.1 heparinase II/III family protein [Chitinophagaceae bacterium]
MKSKKMLIPALLLLYAICSNAQPSSDREIIKLENPVSVQFLKSRLKRSTPRLILTPSVEKQLRQKIRQDPVVKNYYEALKLNAGKILNEPLLERQMEGRRLLAVSREMLYRMNILALVYRIERSPEMLTRINKELKAVCNFSDWNPSHYLDVAEMALAVSIGIDWVGDQLPKATVALAKQSLIEKGINPGFAGKQPSWVEAVHNWNQVCNGGMIAAAITIADIDPELAATTIKRSLDGIPRALAQYAPDGVYPEGATYWDYGTSFSVVTSSILRSAFGSDFGIADYPPFIRSADFRVQCVAPSGMYFNFADCGDSAGKTGNITLAWFAKETGNSAYIEKEKFLLEPAAMGKLPRLAAAGLIWLSEFESRSNSVLARTYKGEGDNPIVIFRGEGNDPHTYYFAGKGGRASLNHGNMDAGSFIFELDAVRWVIDPGVQNYYELEKAGFNLWGSCQDCPRWSLLTKGNFGHSTLTVNDARFKVDGQVTLTHFKEGDRPEASFDMTPVFSGLVDRAERTFIKDTDHSVVIEDNLLLNDSTKTHSWAIMTTASVTPVKGGALLQQEGKRLNLYVIEPSDLEVSVIVMDPPPMELDKKIKNLKKVELRIPAYLFKSKNAGIKVRLSAL